MRPWPEAKHRDALRQPWDQAAENEATMRCYQRRHCVLFSSERSKQSSLHIAVVKWYHPLPTFTILLNTALTINNSLLSLAICNSYAYVLCISDKQKYDQLLHDELHWLEVPQQVQYKLCRTVHWCRQHKVPQYMTDCCIHTSDIARQQHLRSAAAISCSYSDTGVRCSVVRPFLWLTLWPGTGYQITYMQDPSRSLDSFRRGLKTFLFSFYLRAQRIRGFAIMLFINPWLDTDTLRTCSVTVYI